MTFRSRAGLAALLFGLLVADGAAWSYAFGSGKTEQGMLLLYPEQLDGQQLVLSLVKVVELREGGYRVEASKQSFSVEGDPSGLSVGDEIYVGGRFQADGFVVHESWREVAPDRGNKKVLGVLGLLSTAALMPFVLGLRRDGLVLRG